MPCSIARLFNDLQANPVSGGCTAPRFSADVQLTFTLPSPCPHFLEPLRIPDKIGRDGKLDAEIRMNRAARKPAMPEWLFPLTTLLMLAAALSLVLSGSAAEDRKASVTERAAQLIHSGDIEQAEQLLQSVLASHPEDLEARLALANLYAENHHTDKAEMELREALHLHPGASSAELALGALYMSTGSLGDAELLLKDAVDRHPDLTAGRAELSLVLAMEHKYAQAKTEIRMIPPPAESNAKARYFRLVASIDSGLRDSAAAAHAMEEALQVVPANEELQLLTSITEADAGEWQACIRNVAPLYARHPASNSGLLLLRAQLATHTDFLPTLQSLRALDLARKSKAGA